METDNSSNIIDNAVAEGGAYEIIRRRLDEQGKKLRELSNNLNQSRLKEFGSTELAIIGRVRIRTGNNSIARDIVQAGELLIFGYNVFIGLKKETKVEDVFSVVKLLDADETSLEEIPLGQTFLYETRFLNDFSELYRYYKKAKLLQLVNKNGKLLAGFQIGDRIEDIRVFRWGISPDGKKIEYIDNRGERDLQLPPKNDFEWKNITREDTIHGRHPHANIKDEVFVETVGGTLTVKVENNTEDGLGIYNEPVEDKTQSLDDAEMAYATVGSLILIKVLPYREEQWRYLIFNKLTKEVVRIDELGQSCVQLPEDHGVIFPGGYYLQTGEHKKFEANNSSLTYKRTIRSPNGEDVLYIFYEPEDGIVGLLTYNLINKTLQNPIYGHGYALADDGTLVIFTAENEPTRVHPMQVWKTPYISDEFAAKIPQKQNFYGRIGNAELVRGISDLLSICRAIENQKVTAFLYEELARNSRQLFDSYYWLNSDETSEIKNCLQDVGETAELVIDEFEKIQSIQAKSAEALDTAEKTQKDIQSHIRPENWEDTGDYVAALKRIRQQRGHLATISEYRYIDKERIASLDSELKIFEENLSQKTVQFLNSPEAIKPYLLKIDSFTKELDKSKTKASIEPILEEIESTASALDLISELMTTIQIEDSTIRTQIIDAISEVYAKLNQCRAKTENKRKALGSDEAIAQFSAQFKLFSQSINNALGLATTPEKCDEQLSRLLVQLEELESQFSEFDQFLADILAKRDEIYEAFEAHKQQLLEAQQRKAQNIFDAAERILASIDRRILKFKEQDELNTYFASDALVLKINEMVDQLNSLSSSVKADDISAKIKHLKDNAFRSLRDKADIYEDGGKVIKLGPRHRFSVNTQELDLTIIPRNNQLYFHLSGTDYYELVTDIALNNLSDFWDLNIESESPHVYRAEYLAYQILKSPKSNKLGALINDEKLLLSHVRDFATPLYKEGYEKGIHDFDAAQIIKAIYPVLTNAELLKFDPESRAIAQIFWANIKYVTRLKQNTKLSDSQLSYETWRDRSITASQMRDIFASNMAKNLLENEIESALNEFIGKHSIDITSITIRRSAEYLTEELSRDRMEFVSSKYARELVDQLKLEMSETAWRKLQTSLEKMLGWPAERWQLTEAWLKALVADKSLKHLERYIPEAIALINTEERIERRNTEIDLKTTASGLLGNHETIQNQSLKFDLDEFLLRLETHATETVLGYRNYLHCRQKLINQEKSNLRLDQYKPRPLSSFVRNRLVNESYLPLIGDNLAKQMGTVGENKRSDLMGLLMMISPPGYGKTTLMEYVANRLGLIFMKINCPSLGHDVLSLDPSQAPNATAKQELLKVNLAFEMGNNVMLYLDDIQHTHPEFLQKFISLCDGTRRIEGVWANETKTYDMRGKKFCVVMAGNPYTEAGEAFKVPDMLANRADIYNLGDILGGMDEQFALSYIENSLTSNAILAPLATREMSDIYKLIDLAKGKNIVTSELNHQYSVAEVNEITSVLKKLFVIQDVILKINLEYIASAAQDDKYRTEPPFKLQGSYRNMNKMAEKVSSVMNENELQQLIEDHYLGEAQMLTTGAEANLLKLEELRNQFSDKSRVRWEQIKEDFMRNKAMGGDSADIGGRVVAQLIDLANNISTLTEVAKSTASNDMQKAGIRELQQIEASLRKLSTAQEKTTPNTTNIEVVNQPVPGIDKILNTLAKTIEESIFPLVRSMDKKLEIDLRTHDKMQQVLEELRKIDVETTSTQQTFNS